MLHSTPRLGAYAGARYLSSKRLSVLLSTTLGLALFGCGPEPVEEPVPNILLLVIDCLRADRLAGELAYPRPATPNLDALAAESVQFTSAFAQTNWTRPSIPTFLTGLYPSEHGLMSLGQGADATSSEGLSPLAVTLAEALATRGYSRAMIGEQHQLAPRFGLNQGFEHYNHKGSNATSMHEAILSWIDGASAPFFGYLHYLELHWPYCPPEETRGVFTEGYEGRNFCFQWRKLRKDLRSGAVVLDDVEIEALAARYDEELLAVDARLGELFAELVERGIWDDSLVLGNSDHGEEFFEHGGMGHGSTLHDELIAVPLIVKPPAYWRVETGVKVDALVELRDLAPTLLEAAGLVPDASLGVSLVPWIRDRRPQVERDFVFAEDTRSVAIRTRELKLIAPRDGSDVVLYDLDADPGETHDVAAERPRDTARLQRHLREWLASLEPLESRETELDEETLRGLRALGYVE